MASNGYNYRITLTEVVPPAGTVLLHYPLADASSGRVDQANAVVVLGNRILVTNTDVFIDFDQETSTITVTNSMQEDWLPQTDLVVSAPGELKNIEDILETLADHEARITALEGVAAAPEADAKADTKHADKHLGKKHK